MSNVFIFEDNEDSPISMLLKSSYSGNNMHFSGGSDLLSVELKKWYNNEDNFFVFMDYVPNNKIIIASYGVLYNKISRYKNVFLVPIPCIEYFVLKMFGQYGYNRLDKGSMNLYVNIVESFNWCDVESRHKSTSLERLYKLLVSRQLPKCLHNNKDEDNNLFGKFYVSPCNCVYKTRPCRSDRKDDVLLKAERLCSTLVMFDIVSDEHLEYLRLIGVEARKLTPELLYNKIDNLYKDMFESMEKKYNGIRMFNEYDQSAYNWD